MSKPIGPNIGRRQAMALTGFGLLELLSAPALARPKLSDDGLYQMDWYLESFLDLRDDLASATENGKRFAIMWGLKGCPACKRMHEVHMMDPKIEFYIRANFEILHLNIVGSRVVTDFDGIKFAEKPFSVSYEVHGTPTIQFFPERSDGLAKLSPQAREVARIPGLPEPGAFLAMFRYVREKGYETATFPDWMKKQA